MVRTHCQTNYVCKSGTRSSIATVIGQECILVTNSFSHIYCTHYTCSLGFKIRALYCKFFLATVDPKTGDVNPSTLTPETVKYLLSVSALAGSELYRSNESSIQYVCTTSKFQAHPLTLCAQIVTSLQYMGMHMALDLPLSSLVLNNMVH